MTTHILRSIVAGLALVLASPAALPQAATAAQGGEAHTMFPHAAARGQLRVGVIHVTPPAAPGSKVRTEDRLDTPAVNALAVTLALPARTVQMTPDEAAVALNNGSIDLALYSLPATAPVLPGVTVIPTTYRTWPQAVIRSDTPIHSAKDLQGRQVCIAKTADHAAQAATAAGATLLSFAVPSDALVAVREGRCDLGLIDQTVWQDLMSFPEWRKFSATLQLSEQPRTLTWLVPAANTRQADWLRAQMQRWDRKGQWAVFSKKWATDVAFDVYLDQEVPDCHS